MYGYSEVRATHAATCSLYIIPVRYRIYCQWVWLSNLALCGICVYERVEFEGGGGKKAGRVKCASESGEGDVSLPD